jgi:hypothetical protein
VKLASVKVASVKVPEASTARTQLRLVDDSKAGCATAKSVSNEVTEHGLRRYLFGKNLPNNRLHLPRKLPERPIFAGQNRLAHLRHESRSNSAQFKNLETE